MQQGQAKGASASEALTSEVIRALIMLSSASINALILSCAM